MNPPNAIGKALETFAWLEKEIVAAQKGPMDPRMRAELARVGSATQKSLAGLASSHQAAADMLAAKREQAAERSAANEAAIAKNREQMAASQQPTKAPTTGPPAIDPTLGARLAKELLARQPVLESDRSDAPSANGVLDDWDWGNGSASVRLSPAVETAAQ